MRFRTYVLLGLLVWVACFPRVLRDFTPLAPNQFDFHAVLFPSDLVVVAVIAMAVRRRRLALLPAIAAVLLAIFVAGWIAHPSSRGDFALLRWAGVVGVAALVDRAMATVLAGGWAVLESLVALAQRAHGRPLGLPSAMEVPSAFVHFGNAVSPPGTLVHPYLLAGLALLGGTLVALAARERRWLLLPAAIAVSPVGFTYSRAAAIGLVAVLVCLAVTRFPSAVVALAIGAALPAAVWSGGWVNRAASVDANSAVGTGLDTGRSTLMRQSLSVIADHPVTGVGPGRYVEALAERHVDPRASGGFLKPVHNLPLLAGAEGGVLAGAAMLALLGAAGVIALRGGPTGIAVFCAFAPFTLLDHFPYTFPQGLVMLGLWLAALPAAQRSDTATLSAVSHDGL